MKWFVCCAPTPYGDADADAATAGYRVGYDDSSHFSREYERLFGEPPKRDVERLRDAIASKPVRRRTLSQTTP